MLALFMLLTAAPAWSITFTVSEQSDPGNGTTLGTRDAKTTLTPTEVKTTTQSTSHGKKQPTQQAARPLDPAVRDAIAALLPSLPQKSASYSISDTVNDEGGYGEELSIEREGRPLLHFTLIQGKQAPPLPKQLDALRALIAKAQLPPPR